MILASDGHPDYPATVGNHMAIALGGRDTDRLTRLFRDLAERGRITMPLASQPWGGEADEYSLHPIGYIRSTLRSPYEAPRQGTEGAPDAWLDVSSTFARALLGIAPGDDAIVITWLHRANRETLDVHPRDDPRNPLAGVFATRSQDRPNPLGLHRVIVREISGTRLRIGPIEAIDGTPVVDIKPVLAGSNDA